MNTADSAALSDDSVIVFSLNKKGGIRTALPLFQSLMGKTESHLKSAGIEDFLVSMPQSVVDEIHAAMADELPWRGILQLRTEAWGVTWFDVFVRPTFRAGKRNGSQWLMTRAEGKLAQRADRLYQQKNLRDS